MNVSGLPVSKETSSAGKYYKFVVLLLYLCWINYITCSIISDYDVKGDFGYRWLVIAFRLFEYPWYTISNVLLVLFWFTTFGMFLPSCATLFNCCTL